MREATRSDIPKGNEAQCVLCWRLFSSDSACEKHKPYSKPKGSDCKNPASLGFEPLDRRGLTVWQPPSRKPGNPPDAGQSQDA